jgi:hypothetical protein
VVRGAMVEGIIYRDLRHGDSGTRKTLTVFLLAGGWDGVGAGRDSNVAMGWDKLCVFDFSSFSTRCHRSDVLGGEGVIEKSDRVQAVSTALCTHPDLLAADGSAIARQIQARLS